MRRERSAPFERVRCRPGRADPGKPGRGQIPASADLAAEPVTGRSRAAGTGIRHERHRRPIEDAERRRIAAGIVYPHGLEPAPEHALDRVRPFGGDLEDLGEARLRRKAVRFEPLRGFTRLPGKGGLLECVERGETSRHRFEPLAPLVQDAGFGRFGPPELRNLPLSLQEPLAGFLKPALQLFNHLLERSVLAGRGESFALRPQPGLPRRGLVEPDALVGERGLRRVRLPPMRLPTLPKPFVFRPESGQRPLRGVEPSLRIARLLAGSFQPGPLPAEPGPEILQPGSVGPCLLVRPRQHLLVAIEGLPQLCALAPELGHRFLGPSHLGPHLQGGPVPLVVPVRGLAVPGPGPLELRLDRPLP